MLITEKKKERARNISKSFGWYSDMNFDCTSRYIYGRVQEWSDKPLENESSSSKLFLSGSEYITSFLVGFWYHVQLTYNYYRTVIASLVEV